MQDEYMLYTEVKLLAEVEEIIQGVQRQFEKQQDLILDCKQEGRHQDHRASTSASIHCVFNVPLRRLYGCIYSQYIRVKNIL